MKLMVPLPLAAISLLSVSVVTSANLSVLIISTASAVTASLLPFSMFTLNSGVSEEVHTQSSPVTGTLLVRTFTSEASSRSTLVSVKLTPEIIRPPVFNAASISSVIVSLVARPDGVTLAASGRDFQPLSS